MDDPYMDFGWHLPPGVTEEDCEEAYMTRPFSDDDLKRLKSSLTETGPGILLVTILTEEEIRNVVKVLPDGKRLTFWDLVPLLARLEAAEDCIDDHRKDCLADIGKPCTCGYAEKLARWRKAAGQMIDAKTICWTCKHYDVWHRHKVGPCRYLTYGVRCTCGEFKREAV